MSTEYRWAKDIIDDVIITNSVPAATVWLKYKPINILSPSSGKWCLWSWIEDAIRLYGCGAINNEALVYLITPSGIGYFRSMDDTFYYARINKLNDTD